MDITRKKFGENIASHRVKAGMTQAKLAEKANLSLRAVQDMEYGKSFAGSTTLDRLSRALGVSVAELFISEDDTLRSLSEATSFLSKLSASPPLLREVVLALADNNAETTSDLPPAISKLVKALLQECAKAGQSRP